MRLVALVRKLIGREEYHPLVSYPVFLIRVWLIRRRYQSILLRLRRKVQSGERVNVMFLSMDTSKWKCQSLYNLLKDSQIFRPYIGLTITDEDENHSEEQIDRRNDESRSFYERLGCQVEEACCVPEREVRSPRELGADIVFYQVPWGNLGAQSVWEVSKYALCCYVPYSIETITKRGRTLRFGIDHLANFHLMLFSTFQWSEGYAWYYRSIMKEFEWAGNVYGFGHPTLDSYLDVAVTPVAGEYIIYAPHFSFEYNGQMPMLNIGTFHWSGREMLSYAKAHPEIKWLFKPHPKLKERLVEIGFMTAEEVEQYYSEWERIGEACYDGDYAKYFMHSKAMVTDSNSFLMEYMAVGKPLIHLVPLNDNTQVCPQAKSVFETFYVAQNERDLRGLLHLIVEDGQDPRKEERLSAAKEAMVFGNCAARRILNWMEDVVQGKSCGGLR